MSVFRRKRLDTISPRVYSLPTCDHQALTKGSNGSRTGPLRKVVNVEYAGSGRDAIPIETLECGHVQHAKRDLMGFTNAYRRRCWQCKRELNA